MSSVSQIAQADIARQIDERTAAAFITAVTAMADANPHPVGATIRLAVTSIDGGRDLGVVDVDVTNLWDLAQRAQARAANPVPDVNPVPAPAARPALRLVGGAA
ncbi:hypothetical protein PV382_18115 [Streptomyces scabiei]|uniref:hypothetical protein n=1 Tax=Streptomyces scabiei TaxID=1930 RepID=UPI0029B02D89|nr:hypothetical protein [Streptomyces scabiei]MDX2658262.1 hypothetical protein [Streptomyces scabiei]MDX2870547.1 hypothetical protein [Streptomyces scabiei]MDX3174193.1 hypothetical protein [Streptomyces scabiei]